MTIENPTIGKTYLNTWGEPVILVAEAGGYAWVKIVRGDSQGYLIPLSRLEEAPPKPIEVGDKIKAKHDVAYPLGKRTAVALFSLQDVDFVAFSADWDNNKFPYIDKLDRMELDNG